MRPPSVIRKPSNQFAARPSIRGRSLAGSLASKELSAALQFGALSITPGTMVRIRETNRFSGFLETLCFLAVFACEDT
jgi:hypothetical protein